MVLFCLIFPLHAHTIECIQKEKRSRAFTYFYSSPSPHTHTDIVREQAPCFISFIDFVYNNRQQRRKKKENRTKEAKRNEPKLEEEVFTLSLLWQRLVEVVHFILPIPKQCCLSVRLHCCCQFPPFSHHYCYCYDCC